MLTSKFFRGLTATGPGSFGFRHQPLDLRDRIALRILLSQADGFAERFASAFRTRRRHPPRRLEESPRAVVPHEDHDLQVLEVKPESGGDQYHSDAALEQPQRRPDAT